jgi:hypothetical protein
MTRRPRSRATANANSGRNISRFQATIGKLRTTLCAEPVARQISAGAADWGQERYERRAGFHALGRGGSSSSDCGWLADAGACRRRRSPKCLRASYERDPRVGVFHPASYRLMDRWVERDTAGALKLPVATDLPKVRKQKLGCACARRRAARLHTEHRRTTLAVVTRRSFSAGRSCTKISRS